MSNSFAKALTKFTKEDTTLRIRVDSNTKETVLSRMGKLHLEMYIERIRRECKVEVIFGQLNVSYKETIDTKVFFEWLHKKQTGGSGQYAEVSGYIEPMTEDEVKDSGKPDEFKNRCIGTNIPRSTTPAAHRA